MQLIRGLHNLRTCHQGCAVTIGNFDGLHFGHQALLNQLKEKAGEYQIPVMVVTFEPHPREFFNHKQAPPRLTNLREKMELLTAFGVDYCWILRFNPELSRMTAEQFIQEILVKKLKTRFLLVGNNFRFGYQRLGNYDVLRKASEQNGFEVAEADTFYLKEERVSSTRVRQVLQRGECEEAKELLGRWYRITGRVVKGKALGRQWGFPTVNIPLKRLVPTLHGIFVVKVSGNVPTWKGRSFDGVASVGTRPTLGEGPYWLEVFLLQENNKESCFENLYGRLLRVDFLHYLRKEERFDSLEALKQQIAHDVNEARRFLYG